MPKSKNPKVNLWRRLRRQADRRRERARERRERYLKTEQPLKARKALRVLRRYTDKAQVALRKIRYYRKEAAQVGKVKVLGWANAPGRPIQPTAMKFFGAVADELGDEITVSTGTNHSKFTTSGSISRHWSGNAGDFGMSWNDIEDVAAAALRVCGWSADAARAAVNRGGLYNVTWQGHRVQVIVNTYIGGNHYNHAHLGI